MNGSTTRKHLKIHIRHMLSHHEGYVNRYINEPVRLGYFIEAFCRLDSLIDAMMIDLLEFNNIKSIEVLQKLSKKKALIPTRVAESLYAEKQISRKTLDKMYKFKSCRNIIAHNPHGDLDVALEDSGFLKRTDVCHNCASCLRKHLRALGCETLDEYSKAVLKKKIVTGLLVFGDLKNSFGKIMVDL